MLFLGTNWGKTLDIIQREMDVSVLRREVIANNIANADTPNFKRSVVNFESQLKAALDSEKPNGNLVAKMNNPRQIPFYRPVNYQTVGPRVVLDYLTTSDNNGNNVNLEQSMMNALNNQLEYQLLSQALTSQFQRVALVLK